MIAICTPTRDFIHAGTTFDLIELTKQSPEAFFIVSQGTILPNQRTQLVKQALSSYVSHVLFIDSDMRFPRDTIKRLVKHDVDVIGANCKHRQSDKWTAGISSKGKTGIETVSSLGFGVTLIHVKIFATIPEPWFATPFDGKQFVGEDVFFFRKVRELGVPIHVDHDLSQEVKHIGKMEF